MMRHALAICAPSRRGPVTSLVPGRFVPGRRGTLIAALSALAVFIAVPVPGGRGLGLGQETTQPAAAKGSFLGALPHDTTLFLRATNVKALVEKLKKSPFHALKDHPDVKDVLRQVEEKLAQGLAEPRKELGFDPLDILASAEGEVVFALGGLEPVLTTLVESISMGQAPNVRSESIPLIIAVDAGGSSAKMHDRFEKIFQFAVKKGARRETVDFQGGKITRLVEDPGAATRDSPDESEERPDRDDAGEARDEGDAESGKAKKTEGSGRARAVEKRDGSGALARGDDDDDDDDEDDAREVIVKDDDDPEADADLDDEK
ncbi:MAG TPA: hypothetical protein VMT52_19005, partial [Planctomycetota bacterium]|nr:hypothetical protein [Planctomycetota bacterium]